MKKNDDRAKMHRRGIRKTADEAREYDYIRVLADTDCTREWPMQKSDDGAVAEKTSLMNSHCCFCVNR